MDEMPASDDLIARALAEDLGVSVVAILNPVAGRSLTDRDVTSASTVSEDAAFEGRIVAREQGVVCGLPLVARAYELLSAVSGGEPVECFPLVAEGASVEAGQAVMEVSGAARTVLAGERTVLDLLMVLSGIASTANRWQAEAGPELEVADTRKTLPGLRALSKYAVALGGAHNHRAGLWDMVLIKDNHIAAAGSVSEAVRSAKRLHHDLLVECEADTIAQAVEAASAGADYVLLDNMDDTTLAEAVAAVRQAAAGRPVRTEVSGGVKFERLCAIAATGVDRVSSSALTLAPPMDFGLDAG